MLAVRGPSPPAAAAPLREGHVVKKLLVGLLLLVVVAALAVELVAPQLAASRIEEHVRGQTSGVVEVSADVGTFPVVSRLLLTERVSRLGVTLSEVAGQQLTFAAVRFDLHGVELDRNALLSGDVRVQGMRGGQATAVLDVNALSDAAGVPVRIEEGTLVAEVGGTRLELPLAVEGRALRLPGGLPAVALPDLVPCAPTETAVHGDRIELSCTLEEVPSILT